MAQHADARRERLARAAASAGPLLTLTLALTLAGCPSDGSSATATTTPTTTATAPRQVTDAERAAVMVACARCHVAPPPEALPRERWREVIPVMGTAEVGVASGQPPASADEVTLALRVYDALAPDALDAPPQPGAPAGLSFRTESFTPPRINKRIPAVANVRFWPLNSPRRRDVLVCEMRSRCLFVLASWAPEPQRRLLELGNELGYPVHVEPCDLDGDGRLDLVVSGLGGMNPSNARDGVVTLLRQGADRRFTPYPIARDLGRVASTHAVDIDGDGDLDLVVAVFGWRGPGELLLLENVTSEPGRLRFDRHVLDERDGWIHVASADLDGDGRLDLVALVAQEHEQVVAWLNREGGFERRVLDAAPHPAWGSSGLELVDMDLDGDVDILLSNGDALDDHLLKPYHGVSWLENQGGMKFVRRPIGALYACERAVAGDLDGDGDVDVVAVAFLPEVPPERQKALDLDSVVWFERTPEGWTRRVIEKHRAWHPTVALADHDADGRMDIVVGNYVWLLEGGTPLVEDDWVTVFTQQAPAAGPR